MSRRTASWLAWSLGMLSVALLSASAVLLVLNRPTRVVESAGVWGTVNVPFIFLAVALDFTLVGALVASRRPGNPIGWVSLAAVLPWHSSPPRASTLSTRLCPSLDRSPVQGWPLG